ncbi:MAG: hypothetical protein QOK39_2122 [Acidimicrobiaceae bacterium]|jgi:hypothetical protein|nr:hypothetical protein [Acidimicrobiaceae bacterium]
MRIQRLCTVVAGLGLTLGGGVACSSAAKPSAVVHLAPASVTASSTTTAPSTSSTSTAPGPQGSSAPGPTTAGTKPAASQPLTPDSAAALILGLNNQIQQAENGQNGPHALTKAEAQAIIDAQTKALGIPTTKP